MKREDIDRWIHAVLAARWPTAFADGVVHKSTVAERAGFIAGVRAAADHVEHSWQSGYRGEVHVGFAMTLRSLADRIEQEER